VVVSGYTKFTENLILNSQEADLLIHEVFNKKLMNHMLNLTLDESDQENNKIRKLAKKVQHNH